MSAWFELLRLQLIELAKGMFPGADPEVIARAVNLAMTQPQIPADGAGAQIAEALLRRAMDPKENDILFDMLLLERRALGLEREEDWPLSLRERIRSGIALLARQQIKKAPSPARPSRRRFGYGRG